MPEGTINPYQNKCNGVNELCPLETSFPQLVYEKVGYYTIINGSSAEDDVDAHREVLRTVHREILCDRGYWCENSTRFKCERGRYGDNLGLTP